MKQKSNKGKEARRKGRDRRKENDSFDHYPLEQATDSEKEEEKEDSEEEVEKKTRLHNLKLDPNAPSLASQANKHDLYQDAVQAPRKEIVNLYNIYHKLFFLSSNPAAERHPPLTLREDFCGTAVLCREWVARNPAERAAWGVDNDANVLAYSREHILSTDPSVAERVTLVEKDVLKVGGVPKVDIIAGLNYGIFYFHKQRDLVTYLRTAKDGLNESGVLVVDAFGGAKVYKGNKKRRTGKGYTYFYEQIGYDVMTNTTHVHLSFSFEDGSSLKHAFNYHFRVYSIPEIREAMLDAGFHETFVWLAPAPHDEREPIEYEQVDDNSFNQIDSWNAYIIGKV